MASSADHDDKYIRKINKRFKRFTFVGCVFSGTYISYKLLLNYKPEFLRFNNKLNSLGAILQIPFLLKRGMEDSLKNL